MPDANPILEALNEPQRQAVLHRDGPLLVLAGPGSGKTRVITRRCAQLVRDGVRPRQILAITFTNKAADEMRRRVQALGVAGGMTVCTFHSLGVRLLREFGPRLNVQPGFSIYDEDDQRRLMKEAIQAAGVAAQSLRPDLARWIISDHKNHLRDPAAAEQSADRASDLLVARVYALYQQLLERNNAVDFDDLLMKVAVLLRTDSEAAERLGDRFRYLMIDEYQDTNHAQYEIARLLADRHGNLCATGDPDQSIYAWRGANIANILDFERDYPEATVVRLEQNYRSHGTILRVASQLIRHNERRKHKDLWTDNEAGAPVEVWEFAEDRDEAERIAKTIQALRGEGRDFGDFAIFYRVNAISRGLEESLRMRGIPYKIARGVEFYNRREIRDTLAYLRVLVNPADEIALLRIINTPARGIGKTTIDRLVEAAARRRRPLIDVLRSPEEFTALKSAAAGKVRRFAELIERLRPFGRLSVAEAINHVLELSGLERALREEDSETDGERLANVEELVTAATRYESEAPEPSLEDFLQRVSLTSDQDAVDPAAGVVMLMTLHAAKGLEFPVVFIAGVEQGVLPHERALRLENGGDDIEEERRLMFVGVTRAERRLFLTHVQERMIRGRRESRIASQFLHELPDDAVVSRHFGRPSDRRSAWGTQRHRDEWGDGLPAYDVHAGRPVDGEEDALSDDMDSMDDEFDQSGSRHTMPGGSSTGQDDLFAGDAGSSGGRTLNRSRRARRSAGGPGDVLDESGERVYSVDDPTGGRERVPTAESPSSPQRRTKSEYEHWTPGMLLEHAQYGVGRLVWVRPGGGRPRAAVRFAVYGEKIFILDYVTLRPVHQ